MKSAFPDELFTIFAGEEGLSLFSVNESTEEEAKARLESLKGKYPKAVFGYAKYIRFDECEAEAETPPDPVTPT